MSKLDEKVALYKKFMDDRDIRSNDDLLRAVTKGLGPSIYKADAETVSGSDAKELATVKNNFLIKVETFKAIILCYLIYHLR